MTVAARHGAEHYAEIGRRGGEQTKARFDPDYYARIGRAGGLKKSGKVRQPRTPFTEE